MLKPSPPAEEPIGLLAAAVRSSVQQLLQARIAPLGLSARQFWVLIGIAEHPCHSQAELSARLRVDEATACRVIRTLAARRWIRTARDDQDRRRIRLTVTPEGDRLVRALLPIAREVRAAVESALTPQERAATRAALVKILGALQRLAGAAPPAAVVRPARRRPAQASSA